MAQIRHRTLEIRVEVDRRGGVGAIGDRSNLQEVEAAEGRRAGYPRTFPRDAESAGGLAGSRRLDDVLVAARDCAEQHSEFRTGLIGGRPELAQLRVCFARARAGSGLAIRQSLPDVIAVIDPPPCLDAELQHLTPMLRAGRAVAGALG